MGLPPNSALPDPFFSIIITTYNRDGFVQRCVNSCLHQIFTDFEVIVVDDGSTDGTVVALEGIGDSRLRVLRHGANRGISPSRHTGVSHAQGDWVVVLDSDWGLVPHALQRLSEIIAQLPADVRVLRSRLLLDGTRVIPAFVPEGPIRYEQRIIWAEEEGGFDAGRCVHRSVFDTLPYFHDRRGAMETLYSSS